MVDRWGAMTRIDSPLATLDGISPEDLQGQPLIISDQSFIDSKLSTWLGHHIDRLHLVGTYNLLNNAVIMIVNGLAEAITLDGIYNTHRSNIKLSLSNLN